MRAAVYTRVSLDRTGEELGVSRQREDCEALITQRGWTLAGHYQDNDVSAAGKKTRPGFEALLTGIERGEFAAVVSWNLDRITRNRRDTLRLIETGQRHHTTIALVRGSDYDLSTPAGRMTADILASVARNEIEVKGDRQSRAARQRAESGQPIMWAQRSFGYCPDKVTLLPVEADAIRTACEQLLAGGSLRSIAAQWRELGLRPPQKPDAHFRSTQVGTILRNPRIAGLASYKGTIVGAGQWQPIVSEPTWRAVHAILTDKGRVVPRGVRTLLGGLAHCQCDALMYGGRNRHGRPIYRCERRSDGAGNHIVRVAEPIDNYISMVVVERLSRPDAADLLIDHDRPDVDALRTEANTLRARLESVAAEFGEGELSATQLRVINERIRAKLAAVETKMAEAGRLNVLSPLVRAEDVRAVWDNKLDLDRRRAVIGLLMTVTLLSPGRGAREFDPDTVEIEWRAV